MSDVIRLPILDPNDPRVPEWQRERYGGRRCVIWLEGNGLEGSIVAGGPEPTGHPDQIKHTVPCVCDQERQR
jgi:hypothetical protein